MRGFGGGGCTPVPAGAQDCQSRPSEEGGGDDRQSGVHAGSEAGRAGDEAAEQSDAEDPADLAGGVEHPGGDPGVLPGCGEHDGGGQRRHGGGEPAAEQEQPGDQLLVAGVRAGQGQNGGSGGGQELASDHDGAGSEAGGKPAGDRRADHGDTREGQQHQAGGERAVVAKLLEVKRQDKDLTVDAEVQPQPDAVGGGKAAVRQKAGRQHRGGGPPLGRGEQGHGNQRSAQGAGRDGAAPAMRPGFGEPERQRRQRDDAEDLARQVDSAVRGGGLGGVPGQQGDGDHADHEVDQEDRPPPDPVHEDAAEDGTRGGGGPGAGGPGGDRAGPLGGLGVGVGDQRQGGGHQQRRAQALDDPPGHQHGEGRREAADQGPGDKDRGAVAEGAFAAAPVRQGAAGKQQCRENNVVAVHDPLQVGGRGTEAASDSGQGDVDDRRVQDDGEEAEAHGGERPRPASGDSRGLTRRGAGRGSGAHDNPPNGLN